MSRLLPLPATYQRRGEDWVASRADELRPGDVGIGLPGLMPRQAITIRCASAPACRGSGGNLVRYESATFAAWVHVAPKGYVHDDATGWAHNTNRARKQERRGHPIIGRSVHGRRGLMTAATGAREMPHESWIIDDPAAMMQTECRDCGRPLVYSVKDALRSA